MATTKKKKWIPKNLKKGSFTQYCKRQGYSGVTNECIQKALHSKNKTTQSRAKLAIAFRNMHKKKAQDGITAILEGLGLDNISTAQATSMAGLGSQMIFDFGSYLLSRTVADFAENIKKEKQDLNPYANMYYAKGGTVAIEAEGDETVELPSGETYLLKGPKHSSGGIDLNLPVGSVIYSNKLKIDGQTISERKQKRAKEIDQALKLLKQRKGDKAVRNTAKRVMEKDVITSYTEQRFQDMLRDRRELQHTGNFNFQDGGTATVSTTVKSTPREMILGYYDPTGTYVGILGQSLSGILPLGVTLSQYAKYKPLENPYVGVSARAENALGRAKYDLGKQFQSANADIDRSLLTAYTANSNSTKSSAVQSFLNLNALQRAAEAKAKLAGQLADINAKLAMQESDVMFKGDQLTAAGKWNTDIMNMKSEDALDTQLATDLASGLGLSLQNIGKALSSEAKNRLAIQAINASSKYGFEFVIGPNGEPEVKLSGEGDSDKLLGIDYEEDQPADTGDITRTTIPQIGQTDDSKTGSVTVTGQSRSITGPAATATDQTGDGSKTYIVQYKKPDGTTYENKVVLAPVEDGKVLLQGGISYEEVNPDGSVVRTNTAPQTGDFRIVVGSFEDPQRAAELMAKLTQNGIEANVVQHKDENGRVLNRVIINNGYNRIDQAVSNIGALLSKLYNIEPNYDPNTHLWLINMK